MAQNLDRDRGDTTPTNIESGEYSVKVDIKFSSGISPTATVGAMFLMSFVVVVGFILGLGTADRWMGRKRHGEFMWIEFPRAMQGKGG